MDLDQLQGYYIQLFMAKKNNLDALKELSNKPFTPENEWKRVELEQEKNEIEIEMEKTVEAIKHKAAFANFSPEHGENLLNHIESTLGQNQEEILAKQKMEEIELQEELKRLKEKNNS